MHTAEFDVVKGQRNALCTVLRSLTPEQWAAETVCTGWTTAELCAHLIVRERSLVAALGIVIPTFSGFHTRGIAKVAKYQRGWLIDRLQAGPPWWTRIGQVHIGEDWIHTQDILRGQATALDSTNELEIDSGNTHPVLELALAKACDRFALLVLRGLTADPFRLRLTNGTTYDHTWLVRPGPRFALQANRAKVEPDVTITGHIGELLLTLTGRERVANVTFTGNPEFIRIVRSGLTGV